MQLTYNNNQKRVIILYGGDIGLQVVRELGKKGIKSIVIYQSDDEFAIHSKYVMESHRIENFLDKKQIRNILMKNKKKWNKLLIIPCNDESVDALSYYKKQLTKFYILPVADYKYIQKLLNKKLTYSIATKAGIPVPKTFYCNSVYEIKKVRSKITFPSLVKPYERHHFAAIFKTKLFEVNSFDELLEKWISCRKHGIKAMITEKVPGDDTHLQLCKFYVDRTGKLTGTFQMQKLRQSPPLYGVGRVMKTIHNTITKKLTQKILKQMPGFVGVAQTEFKYDSRDDKYKLIEINCRNTLFVKLECKFGFNIAFAMYQDFVENKEIQMPEYPDNFYWIHLHKDLFTIFSKGRKTEQYSFWQYIQPYLNRKVFAIESWSDLKPTLVYWISKVVAISKWLWKKLVGKSRGVALCES
ncbi:MAG: ATP-grasp protein-like protein [archaeon GW2011_AR3]|nr:MAG: ATP-grasp protein-like protein [archaeon GW2011_AR3]MBS3109985.1 hypothetical protein [Candidatus Woesearchaeota archaeon]